MAEFDPTGGYGSPTGANVGSAGPASRSRASGARPRAAAYASIVKKHSPDFYTFNPQLHFDLIRGWPLNFSDEIRRRTVRFTYTDRAMGTSNLEWHLDNRDGYLTQPEYMALGIEARVSLGYGGSPDHPAIWTPWRSFIINKISGGVGVSGKGPAAIDEQDMTVVYYARNRNAKAPSRRAGGGGGGRRGGMFNPVKKWAPFTQARGGAKAINNMTPAKFRAPSTKDITSLDMMMSLVSGDRYFNVQHMSDAVRLIAARQGFVAPYALIEDTHDTLESGVTIDTGLTDWAFLHREAKRYGFTFKVDAKGLHWHSVYYADAQKGIIKRVYTYGGPDVLKLHFLADYELPIGRSIKTTGLNPNTRMIEVGESHSATGIVILDQLTAEQRANLELAYKPQPVPAAGTMASAKAQAMFIEQMLRKFKITLTLVGDPAAMGGDLVQLMGTGSRFFDRVWFTEEAKHDFDGSTYQTILTLRPEAKVTTGKRAVMAIDISPPNQDPSRPISGGSIMDPKYLGAALKLVTGTMPSKK